MKQTIGVRFLWCAITTKYLVTKAFEIVQIHNHMITVSEEPNNFETIRNYNSCAPAHPEALTSEMLFQKKLMFGAAPPVASSSVSYEEVKQQIGVRVLWFSISF